MGCGPSKDKAVLVVPSSIPASIPPSRNTDHPNVRPSLQPDQCAIEDAAEAIAIEMSQTIFKMPEALALIVNEEPQSLEEKRKCIAVAPDLGLREDEKIPTIIRYNVVSVPKKMEAIFTNIRQYDGDVLQCRFVNNSNESCTIAFPAGQIFIPKDKSRTQNLILKRKYATTISPGNTETIVLYAYCGNANFGCSSHKEMELTNYKMSTFAITDQSKVWQECRPFKAQTRKGEPIDIKQEDIESGTHIARRANEQIKIRQTIEEKGKPLIVNCVEAMKRGAAKKDLYSIDSLQIVEAKLVDSIDKASDTSLSTVVQKFTDQCKLDALINFDGNVKANAEASLDVVRTIRGALNSISVPHTKKNIHATPKLASAKDPAKDPTSPTSKEQAQALQHALQTLEEIKSRQYFNELVPMVLGGDEHDEDIFNNVLQTTNGIHSIVDALLDMTQELKRFAGGDSNGGDGENNDATITEKQRRSLIDSLIQTAVQLKQELLILVRSNKDLSQAIEETWSIPSKEDLLASPGFVLKRTSLHNKCRTVIDEINNNDQLKPDDRDLKLRNAFKDWSEDGLWWQFGSDAGNDATITEKQRRSLIDSLIQTAVQLKQELLILVRSNKDLSQAIEETWSIPSKEDLLASPGFVLKRTSLHNKCRTVIDEINNNDQLKPDDRDLKLRNAFKAWSEDGLWWRFGEHNPDATTTGKQRRSLFGSLIQSARELKQEMLVLVRSNKDLCEAIEETWSIPSKEDLLEAGGLVLKRITLHKKCRNVIDEIKNGDRLTPHDRDSKLRNEFKDWSEDNLLSEKRGSQPGRRGGLKRTRTTVGRQQNTANILKSGQNITLDQKMKDSTMADRLNSIQKKCFDGTTPIECMALVYGIFQRGFDSQTSNSYEEIYECVNNLLRAYGLFDDTEEGTALSKELLNLLISPSLCDSINKHVAVMEKLLDTDTSNDNPESVEKHRKRIEEEIKAIEQAIQNANGGLLFSAVFDDRTNGTDNTVDVEGRTTYTSVEKLIKKAFKHEAHLGSSVELSNKKRECCERLIKLSVGNKEESVEEQVKLLTEERQTFCKLFAGEEDTFNENEAWTVSGQTLDDFTLLLEFYDERLVNCFESDDGYLGKYMLRGDTVAA